MGHKDGPPRMGHKDGPPRMGHKDGPQGWATRIRQRHSSNINLLSQIIFCFLETPSKSDRLPMKKNSNVFVFVHS